MPDNWDDDEEEAPATKSTAVKSEKETANTAPAAKETIPAEDSTKSLTETMSKLDVK